MSRGWVWIVAFACLAAPLSPRGPFFTSVETPKSLTIDVGEDGDWVAMLDRDPVIALGIGLANYRKDIKGFTATLVKQERIGKTLHPEETITIAVREQPFACLMTWQSGIRNQNKSTLYVAGENGGSMRVWRPQALLAKTLTVSPGDAVARSAARYSITESSIANGHLRTYLRWKEVQKNGDLKVEHLGRKAVAELDGWECHILKRTCTTPENDPFLMNETTKPNLDTAFASVLIYLDAKTGYQIGAELLRADGQRVGAYFFKSIVDNPTFPAGLFTEQGWK